MQLKTIKLRAKLQTPHDITIQIMDPSYKNHTTHEQEVSIPRCKLHYKGKERKQQKLGDQNHANIKEESTYKTQHREG